MCLLGMRWNFFLSTATKEFRDRVKRREQTAGEIISSSP